MLFLKKIIIILPCTAFFGCYHANEFLYHDSFIQMHEYEMVNAIQNKDGKKIKKTKSANIRPTDVVYEPEEPRAIEDKIVSINVTEETPVVDVIMELARMSGTDIQIDPTIVGGVNLSLKDKPLRYVFNRICGLTDTRYDEKYGIVVFSRDLPYTKIYDIDFLDVSRSTSSSITLNTSGLSSSSSVGGGTSTVNTKSDDTFWDDIVKDIQQIIDTTENTNKIYTSTAERIQRIAQSKEEENKLQEDINNGIYNSKVDNTKRNQQNSDKTENKESTTTKTLNRIRVNKRAGILTVTASTKSHRLIDKYLKQLKRKSSAQVLIEMRFLEINLKKEYQAGIDWNNIKLGQLGFVSAAMKSGVTSGLATLTFNKGIDAVASLFERFGSTRTLSNPRINAVNNQPALMTFATNYVYFKTKSTYTPATYNSDNVIMTQAYRNIDSEAQTMPLGIIMSVLPSINIDAQEVILNIKPTISKLESTVNDPAVTILLDDAGNVENTSGTNSAIPVANVRELDTILKLKDGQTAVIGGFTERMAQITDAGIPVMRALPIFGNLFSQKSNTTSSVETIILVKATIVDHGKQVSEYEHGIFDNMADDPRSNEI